MNGTGNVEDISAEAVPPVRSHRPPGRVYFIRAGSNVKIGFSTQPMDRLQSLQTSHPDKLEILCTIAGSRDTERDMHKRFAKFHVRGEWFRMSSEITAFVTWAKRRIPDKRRRAPKPADLAVAKIKQPPLPEVTKLLKLRTHYGANSPIGRHISVLTEAIPNHRAATDAVQKANLSAAIKRTTAALAFMMKAA